RRQEELVLAARRWWDGRRPRCELRLRGGAARSSGGGGTSMKPLGQGAIAIALVLGAAGACDAFSEPMPSTDFPGDFIGGPQPFCPTVAFPRADIAAAFAGPLFAWVTTEERAAIEGGGPILPLVASPTPAPHEQLAAHLQAALPALP